MFINKVNQKNDRLKDIIILQKTHEGYIGW